MADRYAPPTFDEWHQAMKDGKDWAWAPTQVMWRIRTLTDEIERMRATTNDLIDAVVDDFSPHYSRGRRTVDAITAAREALDA